MPFVARCKSCGRKHRCRDQSHGKTLRCRDCKTEFAAKKITVRRNKPSEAATATSRLKPEAKKKPRSETAEHAKKIAAQGPELPSVPKIEERNTKSGSGLLDRLWETGEVIPGAKKTYIIVMMVGLVSLLAYCIFYQQLSRKPWFTEYLLVVGGVSALAYDQFCRARIREEIKYYDGRIKSISWRPWYVTFDSWGRERGYRYYQVRYFARNGDKKSDIVGMSILGSDWHPADDRGWFS